MPSNLIDSVCVLVCACVCVCVCVCLSVCVCVAQNLASSRSGTNTGHSTGKKGEDDDGTDAVLEVVGYLPILRHDAVLDRKE